MRKPIYALLILLVLVSPGFGQNRTDLPEDSAIQFLGPPEIPREHNLALQISAFVRRIFQDKAGNLWFGTNGEGVCRYDGKTLTYYSVKDGFSGTAVRGIIEDTDGNVWFGTNGGVSKYDGKSFVNFTVKDGLSDNDVWSIYANEAGNIWVGSLEGVSRFDTVSGRFRPFPIPESEPDYSRGVTSARIVHCIFEDSQGRMWFGTNGGAYVYDGKSLTNISEKDGLCSNAVNSILEDKDGNLWFATHHKGVSRYDGKSFTNFTEDGIISGNEVWSLYADKSGNIWFPAEGFGVYRYDGKSFTNFHTKEGLYSHAIQCVFEDREGRLWCGGWLGLFRYDGKSFFQVTREGPWK